eukprot:c23502_g1_i1 orf=474-3668(-)
MLLTPSVYKLDGLWPCSEITERPRKRHRIQSAHRLVLQSDNSCIKQEVTDGQFDSFHFRKQSLDEASSEFSNYIHSTTPWVESWWPDPSSEEEKTLENETDFYSEWRVNGTSRLIFSSDDIVPDANGPREFSAIVSKSSSVAVCADGQKSVLTYNDVHFSSDHGSSARTLERMKLLVEEERLTACKHNLFLLLDSCIREEDSAAGRIAHSLIVSCGCESDDFLVSHLIRMFAFFDSLLEAKQVFSKLAKTSVFSWNAIISAHVKHGLNEQGIDLYNEMLKSSMEPNGHILVEVLKALSNMKELKEGTSIHAFIIGRGLESDIYLGNSLVNMYATCRALEDAHRVFNRLPLRDVVTWNTLIAAHAQHGHVEEALGLLEQLGLNGLEPNRITFMSILKTDSSVVGFETGTQLHACIMERGLETGNFLGNCLVDMYVKCECLEDAYTVFERLPKRDLVTFNTLISGYAQSGHGCEALQLFDSMIQEGIGPDCFTFVSILRACLGTASIDQVMWVYSYIIEGRFELDVYVASALVNTLMKIGRLEDAHSVFYGSEKQNVLIWSVLIDGYSQSGHSKDAFDLFQQMKYQHRLSPDPITYSSVLKAFSSTETLVQGRLIHALVLEDGFESDQFLASGLINMYAKCGSLEDAQCVFERLDHCNIVVWSALITGFIQHGQGHKALQLFEEILQEGLEPDDVTFVGVLNACSNVAALGKGWQVHALMIQIGLKLDAFTGSSLIDMYADCGSLENSRITFELLPAQTTVTYNSIITACAQHNNFILADQYFKRMRQAGKMPEDITFLCLLSACNRAGLVDKGCVYLRSMSMEFAVTPTLEHLNLMVDVLGSQRLWKEAEDLLESLPFQCNVVGWMSLLSSCRTHSCVDLGSRCFNYVVTMDPAKAAGYTLMSNIYARAGLPDKAVKIDELRRYANGWKKPGKAFIEIDDCVHVFSVGEKNHPQSNEIHAALERLQVQMRLEGYKPSVDMVLGPSSNQEKEAALCGHCEKVAIAFGLISTPQGTTIRIAKNLRMCADCHSATKIISKIERREIIITDAYCVHKFQVGTCSCTLVD